MAWVSRGGCRYYVRSVRRGHRVLHRYFGVGPEAHLAAALDAEQRRRHREEKASHMRLSDVWTRANRPLARLVKLTTLLVAAVMLGAGYHQHHGGGHWRARRDRDG